MSLYNVFVQRKLDESTVYSCKILSDYSVFCGCCRKGVLLARFFSVDSECYVCGARIVIIQSKTNGVLFEERSKWIDDQVKIHDANKGEHRLMGYDVPEDHHGPLPSKTGTVCPDCGHQLRPNEIHDCSLLRASRDHMSEELQDFGKVNSSIKPRFGLIPYEAMVALANRYELGEKKHKGKTWNATTDQTILANREWIISRAEHVIYHAFQYLMKIEGIIPDDGDDDAGAIMWGGSCLSEAKRLFGNKLKGE